MAGSRISSGKIEAAQNRRRALELRKNGATHAQIAEHIGVSEATARHYVQKALEELSQATLEDAKIIKQLERERLDELQLVLSARVKDKNVPFGQKLKAIDRLLRVMERRSRLEGLDSALKHEHTHALAGLTEIDREEIKRLESMWSETIDGEAAEIPQSEQIDGPPQES